MDLLLVLQFVLLQGVLYGLANFQPLAWFPSVGLVPSYVTNAVYVVAVATVLQHCGHNVFLWIAGRLRRSDYIMSAVRLLSFYEVVKSLPLLMCFATTQLHIQLVYGALLSWALLLTLLVIYAVELVLAYLIASYVWRSCMSYSSDTRVLELVGACWHYPIGTAVFCTFYVVDLAYEAVSSLAAGVRLVARLGAHPLSAMHFMKICERVGRLVVNGTTPLLVVTSCWNVASLFVAHSHGSRMVVSIVALLLDHGWHAPAGCRMLSASLVFMLASDILPMPWALAAAELEFLYGTFGPKRCMTINLDADTEKPYRADLVLQNKQMRQVESVLPSYESMDLHDVGKDGHCFYHCLHLMYDYWSMTEWREQAAKQLEAYSERYQPFCYDRSFIDEVAGVRDSYGDNFANNLAIQAVVDIMGRAVVIYKKLHPLDLTEVLVRHILLPTPGVKLCVDGLTKPFIIRHDDYETPHYQLLTLPAEAAAVGARADQPDELSRMHAFYDEQLRLKRSTLHTQQDYQRCFAGTISKAEVEDERDKAKQRLSHHDDLSRNAFFDRLFWSRRPDERIQKAYACQFKGESISLDEVLAEKEKAKERLARSQAAIQKGSASSSSGPPLSIHAPWRNKRSAAASNAAPCPEPAGTPTMYGPAKKRPATSAASPDPDASIDGPPVKQATIVPSRIMKAIDDWLSKGKTIHKESIRLQTYLAKDYDYQISLADLQLLRRQRSGTGYLKRSQSDIRKINSWGRLSDVEVAAIDVWLLDHPDKCTSRLKDYLLQHHSVDVRMALLDVYRRRQSKKTQNPVLWQEEGAKTFWLKVYQKPMRRVRSALSGLVQSVAHNAVRSWIYFSSWSYCPACGLRRCDGSIGSPNRRVSRKCEKGCDPSVYDLERQKLESVLRSAKADQKLRCYVTPRRTDWPVYVNVAQEGEPPDWRFQDLLYGAEPQDDSFGRKHRRSKPAASMLDLTPAEAFSLQIVDIYPKPKERKTNWTHLMKSEVVRVWFRKASVRTTALAESQRAADAYDWLVENNRTYREWIAIHELKLIDMASQKQGETWYIPTATLLLHSHGIEVAARPYLYPRAAYGDSDLKQRLVELGHLSLKNKSSLAASFMRKTMSRCGTYAVDFMLLCLIYDLNMARTIYGIVQTAATRKQCPEVVADNQSSFDSYWRHEEDVLVDMVRQRGHPSIFITIAPAEWKFPMLQELLADHTEDPIIITITTFTFFYH